MTASSKPSHRAIRLGLLGMSAALLLAACGNQYGPPIEGKPLTWGQQRYLDNQRYQQMNEDRRP